MLLPTDDTVSVVIAAYNAAPFIHRAVLSALSQGSYAREVLIVDDGSTDATFATIQQLSNMDPRIRLIRRPKNEGPSTARNVGLDAATGKWIAILDADDAFEHDRLARMLSNSAVNEADIVVDIFRYYDPSSETAGAPVLPETGAAEIVDFATFLANVTPLRQEPSWGLLKPIFRRSFLDRTALRYPTHSRHGEDLLFTIEAFMRGARYALLRYAGYLYTSRHAGLSRTTVNYSAMQEHLRAFAEDPRIGNEPIAKERLEHLVTSLGQLILDADFRRYLGQGAYSTVLYRILCDSSFRAMLLWKLRRRFLR